MKTGVIVTKSALLGLFGRHPNHTAGDPGFCYDHAAHFARISHLILRQVIPCFPHRAGFVVGPTASSIGRLLPDPLNKTAQTNEYEGLKVLSEMQKRFPCRVEIVHTEMHREPARQILQKISFYVGQNRLPWLTEVNPCSDVRKWESGICNLVEASGVDSVLVLCSPGMFQSCWQQGLGRAISDRLGSVRVGLFPINEEQPTRLRRALVEGASTWPNESVLRPRLAMGRAG